jgi:hypothetical protein
MLTQKRFHVLRNYAKIGGVDANVPITFKVEKTTEGKLYATVHNLVNAYQVGVGYQDYPIGGQSQ